MQKNNHFKFFNDNNIKKIIDEEGDRIFKISISINEKNKNSVLVVAKAPKPYQLEDSMKSLKRATKYLLEHDEEFGGIKNISFVFVFPSIEYTKYALEEVFKNKGELFLLGNEGIWQNQEFIKNDLVIFEEMIDCNHIIFAWGEPPTGLKSVFEDRIQYILKGYKTVKNNCFDLKRTYVVGNNTSQGYPRSCSAWAKDMELVEWQI
ncbi:MAG: DUF1643 domain-containing protein [Clostridium perfringens]|nr:DUF1643 domain-containing protein [Clostridium perfringens]